jgi:hypothetical protein
MSTRNFVVKNGLTVGNVTISASTGNLVTINANLGNLATANFFSGDGGLLSNINGANITGNISGNISNANYATYAGTIVNSSQPNITSVGTLTALSVTGNVSAGGLLTNNLYYANGTPWDLQEAAGSNNQVQFNTNNNFAASANFTFNPSTNLLTVTGNIAGSNINAGNLLTANYVAGTLTTNAQPNITSVGTLTSLSVTGNASAGNLSATGDVSGATLTGTLATAAQPNVTSVGTLSSLTVTGNVQTSANLITDLIVGRTSGVTITATGSNQNVNLTPTGTGTVNVGNFIISNVATPVADSDAATKKYVDDVAQGLNIHDSCQAATPNTLAVVTGGTITYNNGANGVGANLTTTGSFNLIDGVNVQTSGTRILVKNEANAVHNGIYTWSNATVITRATDFNSVPEVEAGDFTFVTAGTLYDNTGWVQTSSPAAIGTAGNNIEFTQFSGAGTYTAGTGLQLDGSVFSIANTTVTPGSYGNGDYVASFTVNQQGQLSAASNVAITANAANLTGTTLASTIVNSSLTSVGTLGSLAVTANVTAGNVYANSGTIGASLLAGTLTTASQPNITSVGTLTSLSVTGNVSAGNVSGTTLTGSLATASQPNVTSVGTLTALTVSGTSNVANLNASGAIVANGNITGNYILGNGSQLTGIDATSIQNGSANVRTFANANVTISAAGNANVVTVTGSAVEIVGNVSASNANLGNAVTANFFIGSGANLANIAGANVTGTVANATTATTAGTVTTAAQPNITSVGTLTALSVTGNASAGNFTGANLVSANFVTGTLTTAAQPNITSVGSLTSLDVTGNVTAEYIKPIGYSTDRANVSVTTNTVIDQFNPATFRTAKYVISASGDNGYQSVETLLVHDGVDAYITIYGSICSNLSADIIDVSANINGVSGNVALYATTASGNVKVNVVASYILT